MCPFDLKMVLQLQTFLFYHFFDNHVSSVLSLLWLWNSYSLAMKPLMFLSFLFYFFHFFALYLSFWKSSSKQFLCFYLYCYILFNFKNSFFSNVLFKKYFVLVSWCNICLCLWSCNIETLPRLHGISSTLAAYGVRVRSLDSAAS